MNELDGPPGHAPQSLGRTPTRCAPTDAPSPPSAHQAAARDYVRFRCRPCPRPPGPSKILGNPALFPGRTSTVHHSVFVRLPSACLIWPVFSLTSSIESLQLLATRLSSASCSKIIFETASQTVFFCLGFSVWTLGCGQRKSHQLTTPRKLQAKLHYPLRFK